MAWDGGRPQERGFEPRPLTEAKGSCWVRIPLSPSAFAQSVEFPKVSSMLTIETMAERTCMARGITSDICRENGAEKPRAIDARTAVGESYFVAAPTIAPTSAPAPAPIPATKRPFSPAVKSSKIPSSPAPTPTR
jgi:hypothetical protein